MTALTAWPGQAQDWLDERGKPAWIAAMVLGFIFFWPVGLALLFYMIWSKRMFTGSCRHSRHHGHHRHGRSYGMPSSGNSAFDAYKADTLKRLEEEQEAFSAFLQRLREAKDKQEFDAFMDDRARAARDGAGPDTPSADPAA
ncbi:hypothetical protein U879_12575 [Defluviimonas sp. 20V17]|uniref:DUF2852 domain-containing protein n=1 Tax=Allgaiera indica TaxID=765699 RepID=A0AAN4UQ03_9RHOB|nr:DUF2852 domain-containing protein [Allgaiera indica]KDB03346.1 hypothetical protein U879_12575 [Defluviimonas sp. 20V17]GHE00470.1 hypothetical protein GCM10008024_12100 [Allgaiera indica]SDW61458.1 Protein of unknown function [Allgaiera indica]